MKEIDLPNELARLQRDFQAHAVASERVVRELRADLERCRLELRALETFFGSINPSFVEQFPQVLERMVRESRPLD